MTAVKITNKMDSNCDWTHDLPSASSPVNNTVVMIHHQISLDMSYSRSLLKTFTPLQYH